MKLYNGIVLQNTRSVPQALKEVSVADNALTHLPASFTRLASLSKLWLYGNQLAALPPGLPAAMPSLSHLWLEDNPRLAGPAVLQLLSDVAQRQQQQQPSTTTSPLSDAAAPASPSAAAIASEWRLRHPRGLGPSPGRTQSPSGGNTPPPPPPPPSYMLKALGLDTRQLQGMPLDLMRRVGRILKVRGFSL
jgi:hypothetical protein